MGDLNEGAPQPVLVRERVRVQARRKRIPRRLLLSILGAVVVLAALLALGLIPANAARDQFLAARSALEAGKAALLDGDAEVAEQRFREAEDALIRAHGHASNPLLRLGGLLPVLGRTPDAVVAMAESGRDVARAGQAIAGSLSALPDGLASLAPIGGRVPLEALEALGPGLEEAARLVRRADDTLAPAASSGLLGGVAEARLLFGEQLDDLRSTLEAARLLVNRLPAFLGAGGSRSYFFAAQNPAELRGTGGLIGAFAILTAENGRLSFSPFRPTRPNLPNVPAGEIEAPNPDYERRYAFAGGAGFWQNLNLTPDFPSAAVAIERLYERVRGVRLDGVIAADPFALRDLMGLTGSVRSAELGYAVTAENVVPVLANRAFDELGGSAARKRILGDVARVVFERFLEGTGSPAEAGRALAATAGQGHLLLHSADPGMQEGLELAGVAGRLLPVDGDYLAPVVSNAGGNKVDFYAQRAVAYTVQLGAEGTASSELVLTIENAAPRTGHHPNVIGPNEAARAGENVSLVSTFLSDAARLIGVEENGRTSGAVVDAELGHTVATSYLRIASGGTGTVSYRLSQPTAWSGSTGHGIYRLTFQGQTTINPTDLTIDIRAPDGARIVRTSVPMEIDGGRAVWSGVAPYRQVFEIEFQKPMLSRTWDALSRFFGKPLF